MRAFSRAQGLVTILFLACITAYLVSNAVFQGPAIYSEMQSIEKPSSASEVAGTLSAAELVLDDQSYRKYDFIDAYSYIQVLLGKEENDAFDLVRSQTGELLYGDFYNTPNTKIEEYAMRVARLNTYAKENGAQLIFLNSNSLHTEGYTTYSIGLPFENTNLGSNAMLYYLQSYGVDTLDARAILRDSGMDPALYRYKTDHHWRVEAGFVVFQALVNTLEQVYGETLDPEHLYTDLRNYTQIEYPQSFAGTFSRRAGIPFSGLDDFTLILPNFSTSFTAEADLGDRTEANQGDFTQALIDTRYLGTKNIYTQSLYTAYLGGSVPFRRIINNEKEDGLRILFLHDSFGLPLASFLASTVSQIDMIWPLSASMYGYEVDIDSYVQEHIGSYDYIIMEMIPGNYTEDGFSFFRTTESP